MPQQTPAKCFPHDLHCISSQFIEPLAYPLVDLISDFPKFGQLFLIRSLKGHGIFKGPKQALPRDAGKGGGTSLFGSITHDDDVGKIYFAQVFFDSLGVLAAQVEPHFCHDLASEGIDVRGLITSAINLEAVPGVPSQPGFRHLAASRVVSAQE